MENITNGPDIQPTQPTAEVPRGLGSRMSDIGRGVKSALDFRGKMEDWTQTPLPTITERGPSGTPSVEHLKEIQRVKLRRKFGEHVIANVLPPKRS